MPVDDTLLQECHITHLAWTHGLTIWCQYHIKKQIDYRGVIDSTLAEILNLVLVFKAKNACYSF